MTGGSTITAAGDIGIRADDNTTIIVVAGGFAVSKTAAVGVAASTIYEENTITGAHRRLDGHLHRRERHRRGGDCRLRTRRSDLSQIALGTSGIVLPETNSSQVINVTAGGAGSTGGFAGGFGVSVNIINNTIDAEISNAAIVDAAGDVTVSAIDSSAIDAIAVGGAGSSDGSRRRRSIGQCHHEYHHRRD